MTRSELVKAVLQNAMTVSGYKNGADGRGKDHLCDCIGLIIGAYEILGVPWRGEHGTNWTARNKVYNLAEFKSTIELKVGDVVFKAREPGESGYALPDRYKSGTDLKDYYHIGVVTSDSPFAITHCTTVPGGIKTDNGKMNWKYKAVLNDIEERKEPMTKMQVTAESGNTVNLRSQPALTANVLRQVPVNSIVDLYENNGEWSKICFESTTGYMMSKFLVPVAGDPPADEPIEEPITPIEGAYVNVKMPEDLAFALWEILDGVVGKG